MGFCCKNLVDIVLRLSWFLRQQIVGNRFRNRKVSGYASRAFFFVVFMLRCLFAKWVKLLKGSENHICVGGKCSHR